MDGFWQKQMTRRRALTLAGAGVGSAALLAACSGSDDKPASSSSSSSSSSAPEAASKREVSWTFQTGWFAQVESAAILTPLLYNTLPPNIHLTVKDGGPGQTPINSLAVGQLDMASVSADTLLFSRDQGMPLKVIMSPMSQLPIAFVAHKEANVKSFEDFKGKPVATSNGTSYWEFMKKKYGLSDSNKRTYTGSMAVWLQDKSLICQCIATNEIYTIEQAKVPYDMFLIKDIGYDSPINMFAVTDEFAAKNKDVLPSFLKAVREGMEKALADPMPLFNEIKKRSPQTEDGNINFSFKAMKSFLNRPYTMKNGWGSIDPAQMTAIYNALKDLGLFKGNFKLEDTYTNEFVPSQVLQVA